MFGVYRNQGDVRRPAICADSTPLTVMGSHRMWHDVKACTDLHVHAIALGDAEGKSYEREEVVTERECGAGEDACRRTQGQR